MEYQWEAQLKSLDGGMSCVILHQTVNGIHWVIHRVSGVLPDVGLELVRFQQRNHKRAFVFAAHPRLRMFPWCLNPTINNKHAIKALQRQPFLRAVREHQFNRDRDDCIFFRLATELFFTPVSPRPITQYDPGRQLTPPVGVLERLETFQQSCKP